MKHYNRTWGRLMKGEARFPLHEYGERSVLTTWTMSYEQVQRQSEETAWLLKLWGFLDSGEVWYELIAASSALVEEMDVPTWLLAVAEDELTFSEAMGLLSRYSLVEGKEGTDSHSVHSVLHRWCRYLAEGEERQELVCLAAGLVASSVPLKSEVEFWRKRKRITAHGLCVSRWIEEDSRVDKEGVAEELIRPGFLHSLGYLLDGENRQQAVQMLQRALQGYEKAWGPEHIPTLNTVSNLGLLYAKLGQLDEAEKMYQRALQGYEKALRPEHTTTLNTVNNLGSLYSDLGQLDEAEKMYQRALRGYERAWGPEHISTLGAVNNLGVLYTNLGQLDEAEKMYQRAIDGYAKAINPENLITYVPALNTMWAFGSLHESQGHVDDARHWYSQALLGHQKTFGPDHDKCKTLRDKLALLIQGQEARSPIANRVSIDTSPRESVAGTIASLTKQTWYQHRLRQRLRSKERGRGSSNRSLVR
jgi:tetratricopeptide (TPR) repeat protein